MQFIPDLTILATFTLATLVIGLTPGPDMTLFLGKTIQHGKPAGHAALIGAMSGLVVHTLLVAFGVSALLAASQTAFTILKIVGAAYLLWLAVHAIRNGSAFNIKNKKSRSQSLFSIWLTGFWVNLLNPKIVLFFITFLPQFVAADDPNATEKFLFLGFYFLLISIVVCLGIVAIANRFVTTLTKNPKIMRIMDYSFAGIFSAFAIKILMTERL